MSDGTSIEWTDATWNPITGCSVKSAGCKNCYAMKLAGTRLRNHPSRAGLTQEGAAGPVWTGEVRFNSAWLEQPIAWTRPRKVFVCAHGDLFHEAVPNEWIDAVFKVMLTARQHIYQVLTKRPDRMADYLFKLGNFQNDPPLHIWFGTSIEDARSSAAAEPPMYSIAYQGYVTWVSYEPALGPIDWDAWEFTQWVVSGGESGRNARPSHPDLHRSARDFCARHDIPYLFKQWGEFLPADANEADPEVANVAESKLFWSDGSKWDRFDGQRGGVALVARTGKKAAGRLLDGIEHNGFPKVKP